MHYIALQSLGDNLISLSLLKSLDKGKEINILGTKHTKDIAKLIGVDSRFNIKAIFDDVPAFYDIKKQGILKAIKDFYMFLKYVNSNAVDEMVFEKRDFRSELVKFLTKSKVYCPDNSISNAYKKRRNLIAKVYKQNVTLNLYPLTIAERKQKTIIINPLTKVNLRNIKYNHLKHIINELDRKGHIIYLIDLEKKYQLFKNKVRYYLSSTSLEEVKRLMKNCDLYIGGDSFLVHLAYYLKSNYFVVFYNDNYDFLPPNATEDFYIKAHRSINFNKEISEKFTKIGV